MMGRLPGGGLCLLVLFYFKYADFAVASWNRLASFLGRKAFAAQTAVSTAMMPVGLSFYIFCAIGYLADVYREDTKAERNILRFMLFMSFFPKMVQGPIERSSHLLEQLRAGWGKKVHFRLAHIDAGLLRMMRLVRFCVPRFF